LSGVSDPLSVLTNQPSTAPPVVTGLPGLGFDHHLNRASGRYSEQAKAKQAAELAHTMVAQALASCWTDGKPNLIASSGAIHGLEHKVETEGELQLANYDDRRLAFSNCDQVAAADLTLHGEAARFQEALDGFVKARLGSPLVGHGLQIPEAGEQQVPALEAKWKESSSVSSTTALRLKLDRRG
jgi:hypothetical protein